MFSLYLTEFDSNLITFGGYSSEILSDSKLSGMVNLNSEDSIFWIDLNSDSYWQVTNFESTIGANLMELTVADVIFDSASPYVYLP